MPSPIGHAMAGAMVAWIAGERPISPVSTDRPSLDRWLAALTPLTITCAVLAVSPDFDNFFRSHRTYSHSLGAAGIVWALAAVFAWRLRRPVLKTATICAAAYASHVLLDWLGRDQSLAGGIMALWPLSTSGYRSGLNIFLEFVPHPSLGITRVLMANASAFAREMAILAPPFFLTWLVRVKAFPALAPEVSRGDEAA